MYVVRPITMNDLDELYRLATEAEFGMTTLTKDKEILRKRIRHSEHSMEELGEKPAGQSYIFVLENLETGQLVGTSGVEAKVGGFEPFYSFRLETLLLKSEQLNKKREERVLHLNPDHSGPSAVGMLFLEAEHRRGGIGRFLSLVRFLFMADFNQSFEKEVIAEMRGVNDEQGNSPFWESVGRIFFDIDFPTADYLSGIDKSFIRDLMPPYPIYASLLPKESQNVIGKVHPKTEPALNILYNEGFRFSGFVDIFDGGPLVIVELDQIRSIRTSEIARVESICQKPPESQDYVISNTRHDFRAIKGQLSKKGGGVQLSEEEAQALQVNEGDPVRYVLLRH